MKFSTYWDGQRDVSVLKGKTITKIVKGEVDSDELILFTQDGKKYTFPHIQDCCEHVRIVDVVGEYADLIGEPLLEAEESTEGYTPGEYEMNDSHTWTFYRLGTRKGSVVVRWLGESNGYCGEGVDLVEEPA